MYLYAEEKLKKDLEEQESKKVVKEQEINEISEKLYCIADYEELDINQLTNVVLAFLCIVFGGTIFVPSMICLIKAIIEVAGIGSTLFFCIIDILGTFLLCGGLYYIREAITNYKKRKALKRKGVKKLKKQRVELQNKKSLLSKEKDDIQNQIDKIISALNHIDFFRKTMNDAFYQADTKEEYEKMISSVEINDSMEVTELESNPDDLKRERKV